MRIESPLPRTRILRADEMAAGDRHAIESLGIPSPVLMERAAAEVVRSIRTLYPDAREAVVLAGPGNNGGDGLAVARMLHLAGWQVAVLLQEGASGLGAGCLAQRDLAERVGVRICQPAELATLAPLLRAGIFIDALLGIGFHGRLRDPEAKLLEHLGSLLGLRGRRRCVAIDIPSGIDATTGQCGGPVLPAGHTLSIAALKWGHLLAPGADLCGALHVLDIGIPDASLQDLPGPPPLLLAARDVAPLLRPLPAAGHKGRTGTLRMHAGSADMPGAAALACAAALRAGAGLITLQSDPATTAFVLARHPEAIGDSEGKRRADAALFGSGLGRERAREILPTLLTAARGIPVVVDGDGLHALASALPRCPEGTRLILTPHPGELATLCGSTTEEVLRRWPEAAREVADRYDAIVLAKARGVLIAAPGETTLLAGPGPAGLAKAGSGDVLAGLCAALCLRHPPRDAAILAAWLHAEAGHRAQARWGDLSMQATDLIEEIPPLLMALAETAP